MKPGSAGTHSGDTNPIGIFYVLYLSIVAYYKIKANAVSSFDIGIFSQMFERMRHDFLSYHP